MLWFLRQIIWEHYLKQKTGYWWAGSSLYVAKIKLKSLNRKLERLRELTDRGPEWALGRTLAYLISGIISLGLSIAMMVSSGSLQILNEIYLNNHKINEQDLLMSIRVAKVMFNTFSLVGLVSLMASLYKFRKAERMTLGIAPKRMQKLRSIYSEERDALIKKYNLKVVNNFPAEVPYKPDSWL